MMEQILLRNDAIHSGCHRHRGWLQALRVAYHKGGNFESYVMKKHTCEHLRLLLSFELKENTCPKKLVIEKYEFIYEYV